MSHGDTCPKYPVPGARVDILDLELAELARRGRIAAGGPAVVEPGPCKPRRLSDEEIRQRRERAAVVGEALRRGKSVPLPPGPQIDQDLAERIRWSRAAQAREIHTQDVREGYGNAVPELQEEE
ncbi:hypothetical protein Sipo8835_32610 [Streptomyces ipomoeae]|uniref:Uncharacterized protein n=1 Tax=Streptomyces ipomoeae TaxID=103232 RepID=A0AAE9AY44_9ACTN|nr:hypothetical protein [Streptomyces ipomoeae]TQE24857.1 hypothetical protein Sipo8835_32610 [Streptomyces ipomoeae]